MVRLSVSQTNPKLTKSNQQNHSTSHIQWPLQQQQPIKNKRITVFKKFRSNWRLFPTRMAVCRGLKFASQAMEQIKVHRTLFQEALMWPPPQKRQPYPIVSHTKVNSPLLVLANEGFINANPLCQGHPGASLNPCKANHKIDLKRVTALDHISGVTSASFLHVVYGASEANQYRKATYWSGRMVRHKAQGKVPFCLQVIFRLHSFFLWPSSSSSLSGTMYHGSNAMQEDIAAIKM